MTDSEAEHLKIYTRDRGQKSRFWEVNFIFTLKEKQKQLDSQTSYARCEYSVNVLQNLEKVGWMFNSTKMMRLNPKMDNQGL